MSAPPSAYAAAPARDHPRRRRAGAADARRLPRRGRRNGVDVRLARHRWCCRHRRRARRRGRTRPRRLQRRLRRRRLRPLHEGADAVGSAVALLHVVDYLRSARTSTRFEYPVLMLLATLGMMMMISANDLIALYLGLELQSAGALCRRRHRPRQRPLDRGGLKYFVLGALSSGMLLYGVSLVYGFTGTTASPASPRRCTATAPARPHLRPRLPDRRPRLQGLGGAVPHVDARRL